MAAAIRPADRQFATYLAIEGIDDRGFRQISPSYVRRIYGDLGYRAEDLELHLNVGSASNFFGATAPVPIQLLQQDYSAVYTTRRRRVMCSDRSL